MPPPVLSGVRPEAWAYQLGNRSALEWILDHHFADYKEKVADLLARVTRVSVETVRITEAMCAAAR